MSERDERLLALLALIRDAGALSPRWAAGDPQGFEYRNAAGERVSFERPELDALADGGYLERVFFDRIGRCPKCASHHLNFREVCVNCKSSHLADVALLHHYRCGYVGPTSEFRYTDNARRCPKCHGLVRDRGTDHDVPGPLSVCAECGTTFQTPEVAAVCLGCSSEIAPDELTTLVYEDVNGYRMTAAGLAALRTGALRASDGAVVEAHSPIYRREVFLAFAEDAQRRTRRFGPKSSLLLIAFDDAPAGAAGTATSEEALVEVLGRHLGEMDKIGRYSLNQLLVLLASAGPRQARTLIKRLSKDDALQAARVRASVVRLEDGRIVAASMAAVARAARHV